jgi:hypothetical protein
VQLHVLEEQLFQFPLTKVPVPVDISGLVDKKLKNDLRPWMDAELFEQVVLSLFDHYPVCSLFGDSYCRSGTAARPSAEEARYRVHMWTVKRRTGRTTKTICYQSEARHFHFKTARYLSAGRVCVGLWP